MTIANLSSAHGSPRDRGGADSWYRRGINPHWWPKGPGRGTKIVEADMTPDEVAAYHLGYSENEAAGGHKEW